MFWVSFVAFALCSLVRQLFQRTTWPVRSISPCAVTWPMWNCPPGGQEYPNIWRPALPQVSLPDLLCSSPFLPIPTPQTGAILVTLTVLLSHLAFWSSLIDCWVFLLAIFAFLCWGSLCEPQQRVVLVESVQFLRPCTVKHLSNNLQPFVWGLLGHQRSQDWQQEGLLTGHTTTKGRFLWFAHVKLAFLEFTGQF